MPAAGVCLTSHTRWASTRRSEASREVSWSMLSRDSAASLAAGDGGRRVADALLSLVNDDQEGSTRTASRQMASAAKTTARGWIGHTEFDPSTASARIAASEVTVAAIRRGVQPQES